MELSRREKKLNENIEKIKKEDKILKERESNLKRLEQKLLRLQTDLTLRETRLETAEMEMRLKQRTASVTTSKTATSYLSNNNYTTTGQKKMDSNKWASSAKPFDNKTNAMNYQGYNITSETTKLTEL